jgi:hypothetical protein
MIALADQDLVGLCRFERYAETFPRSPAERRSRARKIGITLGRPVSATPPVTVWRLIAEAGLAPVTGACSSSFPAEQWLMSALAITCERKSGSRATQAELGRLQRLEVVVGHRATAADPAARSRTGDTRAIQQVRRRTAAGGLQPASRVRADCPGLSAPPQRGVA